MSNYQNAKIYKIKSLHSDDEYIGSTCNSLARRITGHRDAFNKFKKGEGNYCSSYHLFEIGGEYIELIETFPCNTKQELLNKEGEYVKASLNNVNKLIPGRTYQEWYEANKHILSAKRKLYRQTHKEQIKIKDKAYREVNAEKLKNYQDIYTEAHREEKREYDRKRREEKRDYINQKQRENYLKRKA
jgi:hypothetical protein